jgi:hypothetical protein
MRDRKNCMILCSRVDVMKNSAMSWIASGSDPTVSDLTAELLHQENIISINRNVKL